MENIIKIYKDRVLVECGGKYYEKPIDTLEEQRKANERQLRQMAERVSVTE